MGDAAVLAIAGGRAALHFFIAWLFVLNGLVYLLFGLLNLHLWRDMVPSRQELRGIGRSAWDHLRLRFPTGEEATRYNVIQKLSYLVLVLVLLPILVLAGLAMSPRLDAASPELLTIFRSPAIGVDDPLHRRVHACDLCDRARILGVDLWRLE